MERTGFKLNRILASLIDGLIMFIILAGVCVAPAIRFFSELLDDKFIVADLFWLIFSIFGSFCIWILYLFFSSILLGKATVGMKLTKLVFARSGGGEVTYRSILFREVSLVVSIVFSLGFALIFNPISILFNEKGKSFYDICSRVKVVAYDENL